MSPDRKGSVVFVVIGDTKIADHVCALLQKRYAEVVRLRSPDDAEILTALDAGTSAVAVLAHDDVEALRYALVVAHASPNARLVVTVFDRTIGEELSRLLPQTRVKSPGEIAAPVLVGHLLEPAMLVEADGTRVWTPTSRQRRVARWGRLTGQLRPHDGSTFLLFTGLLGLGVTLGADWLWLAHHHRNTPATAFYEAARTVATVGPADAGVESSNYLVASALGMLGTIAFTAIFTAGMVERMLSPRLVGVLGRRTLPRAGHVIVVGMGQVGFRLCSELRRLGVPVVAVERKSDAAGVQLARRSGIPVVIADGTERATLERLRVDKAVGIAAVGSNDLDNLAVAIAAHGTSRRARVVIRAGEHEAVAETRSLFRLGGVCDVAMLSAQYVTDCLTQGPIATEPKRSYR